MLDVKSGMLELKFLQRLTMMSPRVVQDHEHRAAQVPQQVAEENADLVVPDVVEVKLVEKAQTLPLRTDRDARDDRDLVATVAMPMHWGLALGRPGLHHVGNQQESGFVGKDDVGTQPRSVFFTCGHFFRFHRSISCSSRSIARFSGF